MNVSKDSISADSLTEMKLENNYRQSIVLRKKKQILKGVFEYAPNSLKLAEKIIDHKTCQIQDNINDINTRRLGL